MFEMSKKILEKVSFDMAIFYKESVKNLNWMHFDLYRRPYASVILPDKFKIRFKLTSSL